MEYTKKDCPYEFCDFCPNKVEIIKKIKIISTGVITSVRFCSDCHRRIGIGAKYNDKWE